MDAKLTEGKFLIYTVFSIVLFMVLSTSQPQLYNSFIAENFLGFHTVLELLSISISVTIFFHGLKSYSATKSRQMLLLTFSFFLVGSLDILHTVSFKGMPFFITSSSVEKATWFWIAARIIHSVLLLIILLIPDKRLQRDYRFLTVLLGMILIGIISFGVIHYENRLPVLFIDGKGTTPLKNGLEYVICMILFFSMIVSLYQYYFEKSSARLSIALALFYLFLTELIFTIYQSVYDFDNFIGHVYKAAGFYFILKGFYFSAREHNHYGIVDEKLISELPGFIFQVVKQGDDFISVFCRGELMKELGLHQEQLVGRPLDDIFRATIVPVNHYCRLSLKLCETIAFETDYMDKNLLISIRPLLDKMEKEIVIVGTVTDMTGITRNPPWDQQDSKKKHMRAVM